jgi:DNA polymerase-3 subunit epsilon
MEHWTKGPFIGFDTESTGVDPKTARILQAAIITDDPSGVIREEDQIVYVDPGVEIPAEASAIHGLTREKLAEFNPWPSISGIPFIAGFLHGRSTMRGFPLVIYNATYDFPLLLAELRRIDGLTHNQKQPLILDPLVIDRALDKYRKGSRKLEAVAQHYDVKLSDAHDAGADARAAIGIMRAIVKAYPVRGYYWNRQAALGDYSLQEMQRLQAEWYAGWRDDLNEYWERSGKADRVTGSWPMGE